MRHECAASRATEAAKNTSSLTLSGTHLKWESSFLKHNKTKNQNSSADNCPGSLFKKTSKTSTYSWTGKHLTFYFKGNTAELKDMLYTSSRALGQGATSRSFPLQSARADCWGSCYRLRSQLQTNPTRALLKVAQTPCALSSPMWDRWTQSPGSYLAVGALNRSGTKERQKEPSDWKWQTNTLHLLHPSSKTDMRLSRGAGGNHMQSHKAQGAERIPSKIQENTLGWGLYFMPGVSTANSWSYIANPTKSTISLFQLCNPWHYSHRGNHARTQQGCTDRQRSLSCLLCPDCPTTLSIPKPGLKVGKKTFPKVPSCFLLPDWGIPTHF